jgi:hypothetical protein
MNDMQIFVLCKRMAKKRERLTHAMQICILCKQIGKRARMSCTLCSVQQKKANTSRTKKGNLFKLSFFRAEVVISAKHISSAPK